MKSPLILGCLSLLFSTGQAATVVGPPYFADGCDVPPAEVQIRVFPTVDFDGFKYNPCGKFGQSCSVDKDCKKPTQTECSTMEPSDFSGTYTPISGKCISGYCRRGNPFERGVQPGEVCDCFTPCLAKVGAQDNFCVSGICELAPCAKCGQPANNMVCCGTGNPDSNGICECLTGSGEGCATNPGVCGSGFGSDICCPSGTKNNGLCCQDGYCDGQCLRAGK
jgi:hypothetical protein